MSLITLRGSKPDTIESIPNNNNSEQTKALNGRPQFNSGRELTLDERTGSGQGCHNWGRCDQHSTESDIDPYFRTNSTECGIWVTFEGELDFVCYNIPGQ
jgi:hypothetical protein